MVALLAGMTISLIFIAAALPSLRHDMQREREEEMFYRGEQIANAIARFAREHNNQYPTSLEQLTELDPVAASKRYLRPSALKDPMTLKGDWRLVRMGDPVLKELALAWVNTMKQPPPGILGQALAMPATDLSLDSSSKDAKKDSEPALGSSEFGPFVGVVSRSKDHLIRFYYGIETYDKSVIIAGIPTPNQMIIPGLPLFGVGLPSTAKTPTDPRCPKGGIPFEIEGRTVCTGVLYDGQCPPTDPRCRPDKPKQ